MKAKKFGSSGKVSVLLIVLLAIIVLCVVGVVIFAPLGKTGKVLDYSLSEPLNGATTARIDINPGDGNLTIGSITSSDPVLASGTLQYLEKQGLPTRSLNTSNGNATLSLKANDVEASGFRFPWEGLLMEQPSGRSSSTQLCNLPSLLTATAEMSSWTLPACLSPKFRLRPVGVTSMWFSRIMLQT